MKALRKEELLASLDMSNKEFASLEKELLRTKGGIRWLYFVRLAVALGSLALVYYFLGYTVSSINEYGIRYLITAAGVGGSVHLFNIYVLYPKLLETLSNSKN